MTWCTSVVEQFPFDDSNWVWLCPSTGWFFPFAKWWPNWAEDRGCSATARGNPSVITHGSAWITAWICPTAQVDKFGKKQPRVKVAFKFLRVANFMKSSRTFSDWHQSVIGLLLSLIMIKHHSSITIMNEHEHCHHSPHDNWRMNIGESGQCLHSLFSNAQWRITIMNNQACEL